MGHAQPMSATTIEYYYNVKDWLGTNRAVLDETGAAVNTADHYPYGERLPGRFSVSNNEGDRFQFTGHEYDDETTYEYHGARYYNRTLGRYMSIDPLAVRFPSHSTYNYVMGKPIMLIDPDGKAPQGDYYTSDGVYIGSDDENDNRVYVAESDGNGGYQNAKELSIGHDEFMNNARMIMGESSRAGNSATALWIAHTVNNALNSNFNRGHSSFNSLFKTGYSSMSNEEKSEGISTGNSSEAANFARAAMINVLTGGADPTGGAVLWDGMDFVSNYGRKTDILEHPKFRQYGFILSDINHVNQMLSFWSNPDNAKYVNRNSTILKSQFTNKITNSKLGTRGSTGYAFIGYRSEGNQNSKVNRKSYLMSTGVQNGTIFWSHNVINW